LNLVEPLCKQAFIQCTIHFSKPINIVQRRYVGIHEHQLIVLRLLGSYVPQMFLLEEIFVSICSIYPNIPDLLWKVIFRKCELSIEAKFYEHHFLWQRFLFHPTFNRFLRCCLSQWIYVRVIEHRNHCHVQFRSFLGLHAVSPSYFIYLPLSIYKQWLTHYRSANIKSGFEFPYFFCLT